MDGVGSKPGVPLAASQGLALQSPNDFVDGIPHHPATLVHIPVGIPNNLYVSGKLEALQHLATSLAH